MKHIQSPPQFSGTEWQTLGNLKVQADSDVEHAIETWLRETLGPLDLHVDVQQRIFRSACDAAARALHLRASDEGFGHVHLLALAPRRPWTKGQSCGFFRLERLEEATDPQRPPDHSIEFYLYLEG